MASVQRHAIIQRILPRLCRLIAGIRNPPITLQQHRGTEVLLAGPPVAGAGGGAAGAEDALVEAVKFAAVFFCLAVLAAVGGRGGALEVGFDGFVLFVELGEVGDEVFDDVGVGEGVDAGFFGRFGGDAAWVGSVLVCDRVGDSWDMSMYVQRHASVLTPSIFIAQLPQIPSRQLLRNVSVGSTSFLILISASKYMGPVLFRSRV